MKNINYPSWESGICQMLPKENTYDGEYCYYQTESDIIIEDPCIVAEYWYGNYSVLKIAWSWEEIRLYLESKGYVIEFIFLNKRNRWRCDIFKMQDLIEEQYAYYDAYEEAREEAIKWCLNDIKTKP